VEVPDARAAVGALKEILAETAKQADIANILQLLIIASSSTLLHNSPILSFLRFFFYCILWMIATNSDDEERATRINGYADALATAAPGLVSATKSSLSDFGTPTLQPLYPSLQLFILHMLTYTR
jgi:hypothetical protein